MTSVVIRGANDVASAVAHRPFLSGEMVVIAEGGQPTVSRRGMAFADALFDGRAELAGVLVPDVVQVAALLAAHEAIPIVVAELPTLLATVRPAILIDARMRKRAIPEIQRDLAPLTIGLGPNFIAGEMVDLAVETAWGDDLGAVAASGPTRPLAGAPRPLAGHGRDRYVYAPLAGVLHTHRHIGDAVAAGEIVAYLDALPLSAPLGGVLRGLTHEGIAVASGTKVIEIDPRGMAGAVTGIGERPGRIANGVLAALSLWRATQGTE